MWTALFLVQTLATSGDFARDVAPLLERHCAKCHAGPEFEGEFQIDGFLDGTRSSEDPATWRLVKGVLESRKMPPKKEPRPDPALQASALLWIDALLARSAALGDAGRPTLRRLNRREYENSVRDLVGVEIDAAALLAPDDIGFGFDNIGDVLSISDAQFEKYVVAAERAAELAIRVADPDHPERTRIDDARIVHTEKFSTGGGAWSLFSNGFVGVDFDFPLDGEYLLRARAWGEQAGPEIARMEFRLGESTVASFDVEAKPGQPQVYEARVAVPAGPQRFAAWFVNDYWNPDEPDKRKRDRNLRVEGLEVAGPIGVVKETEFQRSLFPPGGPMDAREAIRQLAERAWRRPVTREEIEPLARLAPAISAPQAVVRDALVAILCSPRFLFRLEIDPPDAAPGSVRDLDGFELATRLSYFLWSTLPDAQLVERARSGELRDPAALDAEVRRMLADPRSKELVLNFASQWLQLRAFDAVSPDASRFPEFGPELRAAMRRETELLFETVLREDRTVSDLVDPPFTFVNARLAAHYGLAAIEGDELRRVELFGDERARRGGLLQQASVLTVTSNPTRTSPVKRGKWVLETLLGSPPLAPQPGVDSLEESPTTSAATLRERLAQHRADPKCAVCHDRLDPLGFALETYDPIGRWRTEDGGMPIDASYELEDGAPQDGSAELERRIARDPRFVRGLAEKLAVYALGRGLRPEDAPAFDALMGELGGRTPTLTELVRAVVRTDAFRRRVVASKP
jgi:hypothetical protein